MTIRNLDTYTIESVTAELAKLRDKKYPHFTEADLDRSIELRAILKVLDNNRVA
jgi:hypothetical protein